MSVINAGKVVAIVRDAGGRIVGRTRLQKIAYLLTITGLETGLVFGYKHYGPFSEEVATAARHASLLGRLSETEQPTSWGGTYSIFSVTDGIPENVPEARRDLAAIANAADAVELELAATAIFLFREGYADAWAETARRKPEKAEGGRIDRAKLLLRQLRSVATPNPLPELH